MATLTPIEFQRKLEAKIADLDTAKLIFPAAQEVQRLLVKRLFNEGEGAQGKLGTYSTEAGYFSKNQFKNKGAFRAKGKSGKTKFENGEPHKSMYLEDGYKELKQVQGYESSFVNLTYSSDLRNDISTGMKIKGDKVVSILKRNINTEKVEWLSDKYGDKTFKHTQEEKDFFASEVTDALANYYRS